jgi:hypothetical protein
MVDNRQRHAKQPGVPETNKQLAVGVSIPVLNQRDGGFKGPSLIDELCGGIHSNVYGLPELVGATQHTQR